MHPRPIFCYVLVSFLLTGALFAQDKPDPQLIDEFERTNCEEVLARMDNFIVSLQNDPNSKGLIVTYGEPYPRRTAEREMKNAVRDKIEDPGRIIFASGGGSGSGASVTFWLLPPGAEAPEISPPAENEVPTVSAGDAKPYVFGSESAGDLGGCSDYDLEFYRDTMKANPASRGNIVIYETSLKNFRDKEKSILSELTESGIDRKRLRTFFVKVGRGSLREGIELWLLP